MPASSSRPALRRLAAFALLSALLSGCKGPQLVKGLLYTEGMHLYVRAPARQVMERLPQVLAPAGFELQEVYKVGPPLWQAVALLPAGIVGDGQWARISVKELAPDLSVVYTYATLRGGGALVEDPNAAARNLLVNIYLVNAPEVQAPALAELRRGALQGGGDQ